MPVDDELLSKKHILNTLVLVLRIKYYIIYWHSHVLFINTNVMYLWTNTILPVKL